MDRPPAETHKDLTNHQAVAPANPVTLRLSRPNWRRAVTALLLYFGAFGGMLSGLSTPGLQLLSACILIVGVVLLWRHTRLMPAMWPVLFFTATVAISAFGSPDPGMAGQHVLLWAAVTAVFWLSSAADPVSLDRAVFATLGAIALIALYQGLNWWLRVSLFIPVPRLGGTLWNPNNLALVMVFGFFLAFKNRRWIWLVLFCLVLFLTGSRTAILCLVLGLVPLSILLTRWHRWLWPILTVIGIVAIVLLPTFLERYLIVGHGTLAQRVDLWRIGWTAFLDHPLQGLGPGGYRIAFVDQARPIHATPHFHAHNLYLHTAAELGIPGLLALAGLAVTAFLSIRRTLAAGYRRRGALAAGLFVAVAAHGLLDYVYWVPAIVLLGLWTGRIIIESPGRMPLSDLPSSVQLWRWARLVQIGLIGMLLFRVTAELDEERVALARHTTALSLMLAILLAAAAPGPFLANTTD